MARSLAEIIAEQQAAEAKIENANSEFMVNLNEAMRDPHLADFQYEKIMAQIKEFEDELDENSEAAVQLTSFGQSVVMAVSQIGYQNPDLLYFYGLINGKPAQLIQHISQLSFLLIAVPKTDPNAPPHKIGFAPPSED